MSAIITEKFRQHNANQFVESFTEAAASTYYLFLGKATASHQQQLVVQTVLPQLQAIVHKKNFVHGILCWVQKLFLLQILSLLFLVGTGQMVQSMICIDMIIHHQILLPLVHQIFMTQLSFF